MADLPAGLGGEHLLMDAKVDEVVVGDSSFWMERKYLRWWFTEQERESAGERNDAAHEVDYHEDYTIRISLAIHALYLLH